MEIMESSCFPSSQSIAQITWPTNRISTRLCNKCDHSIHLDAQLLDFHDALARSRSGYSPTASERLAYLGKLDETRCEIERHQEELRRLREATQKLEEQQRLLQAFDAALRHIISPIQSLPLELLGLIFQYVCCGKDATDIANNLRHYETKPRLPTFDVSGVCIRWHQLVSSMPILWTSFGSDGRDPKSPSLVRTFLEHSRSNLVDFRLSDYTVHRRFSLSPLIAHCNRWRHVSVAGTFLFVSEEFLKPLLKCAYPPSNLISLDLGCYPSVHPFKLPIVFPSLNSLVLCGLVLDFETPQFMVTTLHLSKVACNNALLLLFHLPNVESLKVKDITKDDFMDQYLLDAPIVLNKIKTLTLMDPVDSHFLYAIKCPHLSYLCLCNSRNFRRSEFRATISLLAPTDCAPTYLALKNMSIRRKELLQLLQLVPSLTRLDVEEPIMLDRMADTVRWTLELLAAPQHLGFSERSGISNSSGDGDVGSDASYSNTDEDSDLEPEQDEDGSGEDIFSSRRPEGHSNLQELLLPQLVELNLSLNPRNELLLDVVRSR
ncbi:hypothetical protein C8R42DRAFT_221995 [Lentinula raphanica]|nr:hypothetical protein C8R42DRAFT_221995 [Lentinula raphanica]